MSKSLAMLPSPPNPSQLKTFPPLARNSNRNPQPSKETMIYLRRIADNRERIALVALVAFVFAVALGDVMGISLAGMPR